VPEYLLSAKPPNSPILSHTYRTLKAQPVITASGWPLAAVLRINEQTAALPVHFFCGD